MTVRGVFLLATLAVAVAALLTRGGEVDAHARLETADPAPGSALAQAPSEARLSFTEEIDPRFSSAALLAADGQALPVGPIGVADDGRIAVIPLGDPAAFSPGSYVLVWRVLSAVDGHVTSGSLAFSVGTGQAPDSISSGGADRPAWWRVAARWIELTALLAAVGAFAFTAFVAAPWLRAESTIAERVIDSVARVWSAALAALLVGLALALADQGIVASGATIGDPPVLDVYRDVLFDSTFGTYWLLRFAAVVGMALIARVALATTTIKIHRAGPAWMPRWLGLAFGAAALVTLPLSGHAAAAGRSTLAIATDWLHLAASAIWFGGLACVVVFLFLILAKVSAGGDERALTETASLVNRFSWTALGTVAVLLASGAGNGALHVAGPEALTDQDYGVTLIAKHLIVAPLLIAAAINLLVLQPRLRSGRRASGTGSIVALLRSTRTVVTVEAALAATVLIAAATLTELAPADAPLPVDVASKIVRIDQRARAGDLDVWLLARLTGSPNDRFTVSLAGSDADSPEDVPRVIIDATTQTGDGDASVVRDRFDAEQLPGSAETYVFPATRLGLSAIWNVEVTVRRAGLADASATLTVDTNEAGVRTPRAVADTWRLPRLPWQAWSRLALAGAVLAGGVIGVRLMPGVEPLAGGIMLVMTGLIAVGFAVSGVQQTIPVTAATDLDNPVAADSGSIQRGKERYATLCASCHGPAGEGIDTQPDDPEHGHGTAALTDEEVAEQRDGDLYDRISHGVPGSEMPAYDEALSESERWDLVNYLRELQRQGG